MWGWAEGVGPEGVHDMDATKVERDQRYGTVAGEPEGSTVTVYRHGRFVNLITYEARNDMAHNAITLDTEAADQLAKLIMCASLDADLWKAANR